jgi:hypothetical protein
MEVVMLLDGKLKRAAILAALDICLKKTNHSPKRCARNLLELGVSSYPGKLSETGKSEFYHSLLTLLENEDLPAARALFISVFL